MQSHLKEQTLQGRGTVPLMQFTVQNAHAAANQPLTFSQSSSLNLDRPPAGEKPGNTTTSTGSIPWDKDVQAPQEKSSNLHTHKAR